MPERMRLLPGLENPVLRRHLIFPSAIRWGLALLLAADVAACKPNESPLKAENEQLRRQVVKQESVIASIQEGTKVMQQQIDLLNRELRESKKRGDQAEAERKEIATKLESQEKALGGKLEEERKALGGKLEAERKTLSAKLESERRSLTAQLEAEAAENRRLIAETRRLTELQTRMTPVVRVEDKGGQSADVPQTLAVVSKAIEDVLARNGYTVRVGLKSDQRAIYVTERKVSSPTSIEVPGFRNEYLLSIQGFPGKGTHVVVKAAFERMAQGGKIMIASPEEIAEIERRLLSEITKSAGTAGKT